MRITRFSQLDRYVRRRIAAEAGVLRMPIHRAFRDDVLVLTYLGDFTTQESIDAVEQAITDPAFRRGMAILFDTRSVVASALPADDLTRRVEWAVSLAARGFRPQFATVIAPSRERIVKSGVRLI
ncbi:MAG TPA: hypothetical protein VGQ33_03165, partial [Vicinamibacteria bacterium]|nr:hypothetical protein [Vicinamibacteria bacterium]